ncbi:transmembrane protein 135-like [Amphibalanus amphitrite]|uniref:transmembrane protein 135-like n=1 Tax=Amphibalanus amphitrite TaxID=1232801 RepID=UPI001C9110F9|nr:transmembrane protein 135-like [Amphibalanus amphitrite]
MIAASKLSRTPYGCHEIAHTWTSSCPKSWLDVGIPGVREAMKIYLPLFMISRLIKAKKLDKSTLQKLAKETLQSSTFLGANCYFFLSCFCFVRSLPFIPARESIMLAAFMSSYMAIFLEREDRRNALTVYMTNVASETLFNILKARGLVPQVPHGERLLAIATLATIFYMHKQGKCEGLLGTLTKTLLGTVEVCPPPGDGRGQEPSAGARLVQYVVRLVRGARPPPSPRRPLTVARHPCCPHAGGCAPYAAAGLCESLLLGVALQTGVTAAGGLLRLVTTSRPPAPPAAAALLRLGFGLGSLSGLFRLVSCLLRRQRGRDDAWHALPAGAVAAAVGLRFFSSRSLTLYLFWKTVEACYWRGAASGRLPRPPGGGALLYALSTGLVLSAAVLEPHQIRRSYWTFLRQLTGGHVAQMNWPLIAHCCGADTLRLEELRRYRPVFNADDVRAASLPLLRQLGQLL